MPTKSIAMVAVVAIFSIVSPSVGFAAKHARAGKPADGACAQRSGRCVSDCDQFNWCKVYTCQNGKSTAVPFWRCYQPSGLCLAPHC
jgi:hypothetical protein